MKLYNEFLAQLVHQATDNKSRYRPVSHKSLQIGDIVLIKEPYQKRSNYPMGKVLEVQINNMQEVTGATVIKGNRAVVQMHAESLIPLLSVDEYDSQTDSSNVEMPDMAAVLVKFGIHSDNDSVSRENVNRKTRRAAVRAKKLIKDGYVEGLV